MENNVFEFSECRTCLFRKASKPKKTYIQICTKTKQKIKAQSKACELHDVKI